MRKGQLPEAQLRPKLVPRDMALPLGDGPPCG
jgi:hypothetical protein